MLAGVKQCNPNLFGDINQMLPIHLRCSTSGTNGFVTTIGSAHCICCYLKHIGLPANRRGKKLPEINFLAHLQNESRKAESFVVLVNWTLKGTLSHCLKPAFSFSHGN